MTLLALSRSGGRGITQGLPFPFNSLTVSKKLRFLAVHDDAPQGRHHALTTIIKEWLFGRPAASIRAVKRSLDSGLCATMLT